MPLGLLQLAALYQPPAFGKTTDDVGAVVSIVHAWFAGEASTLPAASVARTSNACAPWTRPAYAFGLVQALQPPPSSRHSNVEPDSFGRERERRARRFVGLAGDESIVVCGAVVSIVHVSCAGLASTLPAASVARTSKVCAPSARPV